MPRQNRVTPTGEIVAVPDKGQWTGNRGPLTDDSGTLVRTHRSRAWIVCALEWKGNRATFDDAGRWTPLFFLDEATALAAGHRPCFLCRRDAAIDFVQRFTKALGRPARSVKAPEMDRVLDDERRDGAAKRTWTSAPGDLPDGAMALADGAPALWLRGRLWPWSPGGYGDPIEADGSPQVDVLSPPTTVEVLRRGYPVQVDDSAG